MTVDHTSFSSKNVLSQDGGNVVRRSRKHDFENPIICESLDTSEVGKTKDRKVNKWLNNLNQSIIYEAVPAGGVQ